MIRHTDFPLRTQHTIQLNPEFSIPEDASGSSLLNIEYEEYALENGLHVILHEDHHLPIIALNLWYHVGSKNERERKTGFAHLFEHMMFQGSANVPPNGHFRYVQEAGGTLNGSTTFDRTNYYETLPSHQIELGLWLEADRMLSLALNEQTLETQRSVVMEERRTRYDNQPYGTMYEELFTHAYKLQPYRWPTIGLMADLQKAGLEDVREFHEMYYRPGNASLCIAGAFNTDEARILVSKYFGTIPNGSGEIYRPFIHEPHQLVQVRDYVYDAVPLPAIIMGLHIPDVNTHEYIALDVLSQALSSGDSSRLYRKLVYETRAAQSIHSFALGTELPGLFIIRSTAQLGRSLEEIERLIWNELEDIRRNSITERELQKAKNRLEAFFVHEIESLQSRADLMNSFHILSKDTGRINKELQRIASVTLEDIQKAAGTFLVEMNSSVLHFLPYPKDNTHS